VSSIRHSSSMRLLGGVQAFGMSCKPGEVAAILLRDATLWIVRLVLFFCPAVVSAQNLQWSTESVDSAGESLSMAVDKDGNIHISYQSNGMVKYGFRPAHSSRWFTMDIAGTEGYANAATSLAVDPEGNPHVCFTPGVLRYASFDGKKWNIQQIDSGSGLIEYNCSVAIAPDGTQHVTWYQYATPNGGYYLHVKHAVLQNGVWMARTVDFEGQTGKWNFITVDSRGVPHMSYDSFLKGALKYAFFDGKDWKLSFIDTREMGGDAYNRGMGNCIVINRDGRAQISYEYDDRLLYAWQTATSWKTETVDQISTSGSWMGFRTRQALDLKGNPHVVFEDGGSVKHAFWDGSGWRVQVVSGPGVQKNRFADIVIDQDGNINIGYRDAMDGSVKVAVGRSQVAAEKSPGRTKTEREHQPR
jgi:hypothetical protein